jgi:hypothetical protein
MDRENEKLKVQKIKAQKRRRVNTGLSQLAASSNGDTELDQVVQQAIGKAFTTDVPKYPTLPLALFDLPDDERAQACSSKCVKALRLEENVKQIAHCIAISRSLRTMDLDYGILAVAVAQVEEEEEHL